MKKVGIITHYYNSINYGGNLQAYALCQYCNNLGYDAKQISFPIEVESLIKTDNALSRKEKFIQILKKSPIKAIIMVLKHLYSKVNFKFINKVKGKEIENNKKLQIEAFQNFNKYIILHTENVYNNKTIKECINDFDIFITGSDQVWNLNWYNSAYFLDFVPSDKSKLSYAASMGVVELSSSNKEMIKKSLADFSGVSVREQSSKVLLDDLLPNEPVVVIDPTLLLDENAWNKITEKRLIDEPYLFCYFLGDNPIERKLAKKYAKKKHLKLVTIPMYSSVKDAFFGQEQLVGVSPQMWLSLIKYSDMVFTDSFHAVVFSKIFKKQYFVFERGKGDKTKTRIYNITDIFNTPNRFCDCKNRLNLKYIMKQSNINYNYINLEFENLKKKSEKFLIETLEKK